MKDVTQPCFASVTSTIAKAATQGSLLSCLVCVDLRSTADYGVIVTADVDVSKRRDATNIYENREYRHDIEACLALIAPLGLANWSAPFQAAFYL